jgi:hypothetical protein
MRHTWDRLMWVAIALVVTSCGNEDSPTQGASGCQLGTFVLTPSGGGAAYEVRENYAFHCIDSSRNPDIQYNFEDCPDESGDFLFFYAGGTDRQFHATIGIYMFDGVTNRAYGPGTIGAFATGMYQKFDGTNFETGTFTYSEGVIALGSEACP